MVPLLEVHGVSKVYGNTRVLNQVSLKVEPGEILAVLGHNGAGKSTLIKLISGVELPNEGSVLIQGKKVIMTSPLEAHKLGIGCVYQELHVIDGLTVAQNLFLGHEKTKKGLLDMQAMRHESRTLLESFGLSDLDPDSLGKELSHPQKQMIEILAAINMQIKVLLLDEPTSSLTLGEVDRLLDLMRLLAKKGLGIIFITHKLKEALAVSDHVTVLRNGSVVLADHVNNVHEEQLVEYIAGKRLVENTESNVSAHSDDSSEELLQVSHLSSGKALDASFTLQSGQVLGIYGLVGAGRTDILKALFGLEQITGGTITMSGQPYVPKTPTQALAAGLYYLTEDRKVDGFIPGLSVALNMVLPSLAAFEQNGMIKFRQIAAKVETFMRSLNIQVDRETPMANLSGGTQQKVLFARALLVPGIKILMLDEPTKGIDIGSKTEIHSLIRQLGREGYGVIVVSSEVEEIMAVSDRILVMASGRMVENYFLRGQTEEADLLRAALGGKSRVQSA